MNPPLFTPPGPQIRNAGQVNVGDRVLACWTSNFRITREPATVTRVNRSSIRVQLDARDANFALPLAGGNAFSANNCAYLVERDDTKAPGESARDRAEHLQEKAEKRANWAEKARDRADARSGQISSLLGAMNGSPILVGHHSEKRHRRDLARVDNALRVSVEETRKAERHDRRAAGLAREAALIEAAASSGDAEEQARSFVAAVCAELRKLKKAKGWQRVTKAGTYRGGKRAQVLVTLGDGRMTDVWIERDNVSGGSLYGSRSFAMRIGGDLTPAQVAEAIAGAL